MFPDYLFLQFDMMSFYVNQETKLDILDII